MNSAKILDRMRSNPRDWRIEDVVAACRAFGIDCVPPSKGSHYEVRHDSMAAIPTVPVHPPIKPVYVREVARFIDQVRGTA